MRVEGGNAFPWKEIHEKADDKLIHNGFIIDLMSKGSVIPSFIWRIEDATETQPHPFALEL